MMIKSHKTIFCVITVFACSLWLFGCVHKTYSYNFHYYTEDENGTINVQCEEGFNTTIGKCNDGEANCEFNCQKNSNIITLKGGEVGYRELTFIAEPNDGYEVKEWVFNGKVVKDNNTNTFTARVSNEDNYTGVIIVAFKKIEKKTYTLNEVLAYDKSEITKIDYSITLGPTTGIVYDANLEEIIEKLDVEYFKVPDDEYVDMAYINAMINIYRNNDVTQCGWLIEKIICITTPNGKFYSKEPVELINNVKLSAPNIWVENEIINWDIIENVYQYEVLIIESITNTIRSFNVTTTYIDLSDYEEGVYVIKVKAKAENNTNITHLDSDYSNEIVIPINYVIVTLKACGFEVVEYVKVGEYVTKEKELHTILKQNGYTLLGGRYLLYYDEECTRVFINAWMPDIKSITLYINAKKLDEKIETFYIKNLAMFSYIKPEKEYYIIDSYSQLLNYLETYQFYHVDEVNQMKEYYSNFNFKEKFIIAYNFMWWDSSKVPTDLGGNIVTSIYIDKLNNGIQLLYDDPVVDSGFVEDDYCTQFIELDLIYKEYSLNGVSYDYISYYFKELDIDVEY